MPETPLPAICTKTNRKQNWEKTIRWGDCGTSVADLVWGENVQDNSVKCSTEVKSKKYRVNRGEETSTYGAKTMGGTFTLPRDYQDPFCVALLQAQNTKTPLRIMCVDTREAIADTIAYAGTYADCIVNLSDDGNGDLDDDYMDTWDIKPAGPITSVLNIPSTTPGGP